MSLLDCVSRIARTELTPLTSQSTNPDKEMERILSIMQNAEANTSEQLQSTIQRLEISTAMRAYERMTQQDREIESCSQVIESWVDSDLETRLRQVERELKSVKIQLFQQKKTTKKLLSQNAAVLKAIRRLLPNSLTQHD